jgi:glucans biosynthesis protein C
MVVSGRSRNSRGGPLIRRVFGVWSARLRRSLALNRKHSIVESRDPRPDRLHYVDGLRVLALAGVFLVHVSMVFNPFEPWHIQDPVGSRAIGQVAVLMAPWVMPLFMLLAGVSAWFSLQHRSNMGVLRERSERILLPLAVGVLVLIPPQVYLERRLHGEFTGSYLAFYPRFFDGIYPDGNFSWHHLWFLGHLFVYSIVALPLFRFWQSERGRLQLHRVAAWLGRRGGLIWLAVPLMLQRVVLWVFFEERELLTHDWSNQGLLFVAYLYGFALAGEPSFGKQVDREWRRAAVAALVATGTLGVLTWIGFLPERLPQPYSPRFILFWALYAVGAWAWIVALLGAGRRWIGGPGRIMRYAGTRAYIWYLLHQTVIVAGAYLVVQSDAGMAWKYAALLVGAVAVTLAGAEVLARMGIVGRALGVWNQPPLLEVPRTEGSEGVSRPRNAPPAQGPEGPT